MSGAAPRRVTAVFVGLVVATCVTWWLGSAASLTGGVFGLAATLTIVIAFTKTYFIGRDFMDLRSAPAFLRHAFTAWVVVVALAATALIVV